MLWTEEEIELLKQKAHEGLSVKELAKCFKGRSEASIPLKLRKLGINLKQTRAKVRRERKGLNKDCQTKECSKCGETKTKENFRFRNGLYESPCKECTNRNLKEKYQTDQNYRERVIQNVKDSYVKRRESILTQKSEYRENNRELINQKQKEAREQKPEHFKRMARESYARHSKKRAKEKRDARKADPEHHREINRRAQEKIKNDPLLKEKYRQMHKKYYQENKEKIAEWERDYRNNNPQRKISTRLRNRINFVLRYNQNIKKLADTEELLGCSVEQVKDWLESQFTEDMTWDAFLAGEIHIDHIRPCASFDLTKKSEQLECFNWKNLQPLWAKDNLEKGAKVFDPIP